MIGRDAVVIGAGLAGLTAARAVQNEFERVVIVERNRLTEGPQNRKGVPQGQHLHLLLLRGALALEELFPGVLDLTHASGGVVADSTEDLAFFLQGSWMPRHRSGLPARLQTRPFLEWCVRKELKKHPRIVFVCDAEAKGLLVNSGAVNGVLVERNGSPEEIEAGLVVDASGRGSSLPTWLGRAGWRAPESSQCEMGMSYASRFVSGVAGDFEALLIYPQPPEQNRGGALYRQEGGRWIATLVSYGNDALPSSGQEFNAFARTLANPALAEALTGATPCSDVKVFRTPRAEWRHYEKLSRFPMGLAVVGDAVCHFNPIFGQGMSVAAQHATALRKCIREGGLEEILLRFRSSTAAIVRNPWRISTTLDLAFPSTRGDRPPGIGVVHRYLRALLAGLRDDPHAYTNFMRVLHLSRPPASLAGPRQLLAALKGIWPSAGPSGRRGDFT